MVEIKVRTRKEKKALQSLSLALSAIGLSIDDIKNVSSIVAENASLKARLAEAESKEERQGVPSEKQNEEKIVNYIRGPETIKTRKAGE